jgi:hypothetical protein
MLRAVGRHLASRPLLALLIAIDIVFIAIHAWFASRGALPPALNVETDGGIPEYFQYLKWTICTAACAYAAAQSREPLYLGWMALFLYFLIDDSQSLHELCGGRITAAFHFLPALGLRAQDFGELAVSLLATALLGGIVWLYRRSADNAARALSRELMPWLGLLILFGVVIDMIHIQIMLLYGARWAIVLAGLVEDGGEMIAASGLTATVVRGTLLPMRQAAV